MTRPHPHRRLPVLTVLLAMVAAAPAFAEDAAPKPPAPPAASAPSQLQAPPAKAVSPRPKPRAASPAATNVDAAAPAKAADGTKPAPAPKAADATKAAAAAKPADTAKTPLPAKAADATKAAAAAKPADATKAPAAPKAADATKAPAAAKTVDGAKPVAPVAKSTDAAKAPAAAKPSAPAPTPPAAMPPPAPAAKRAPAAAPVSPKAAPVPVAPPAEGQAAKPVVPAPSAEAEAVWRAYEKRWSETADYAAGFRQTIEVPDIGSKVESAGRFYFAKPGLVRWEYTEGPPQTVVGDGTWIWLYQPDLQQVYKIPYSKAFGRGGLVELLAGREGVSERYSAALDRPDASTVRIFLKSLAEGGGDLEVTLAAETFDLRAVTVHDAAGSTTRMTFAEPLRNRGVDRQRFTFTPPAGVDIISDSETGF